MSSLVQALSTPIHTTPIPNPVHGSESRCRFPFLVQVALATKSAKDSAVTGKARGRNSKKGLPPAVIGGPGGEALLMAKLGSQRVNNIFTHLRKVWTGDVMSSGDAWSSLRAVLEHLMFRLMVPSQACLSPLHV